MRLYHYFPKESAPYVVLHAAYRRSRGRRPVATFCGELNPRRALVLAREEALECGFIMVMSHHQNIHIVSAIMDCIGLHAIKICGRVAYVNC